MATQKVKIEGALGGVTRVTEISGARRGDDLYIDGTNLGQVSDIIEVPEFRVEESNGPASEKYWAAISAKTPASFGEDEQDMTPDRNANDRDNNV